MYDDEYMKYLREYCEQDVDATTMLYNIIQKDLEKERIFKMIKKICYAAIYVFFLVWFIRYWVIRSRRNHAL